MISFWVGLANIRGFGMKKNSKLLWFYTFVPRFDPVKVHCILPDLGYLPLLNGKERQLDKLIPANIDNLNINSESEDIL
jgi:hypothetical protein